MELVSIYELKNYTRSQVKDYLAGLGVNEFVVTFPRYFKSGYNDEVTKLEFSTMAYVGQLINDVSVNFGYYVPWPLTDNEFYFEIEIADVNALAAVLARVTSSLFTDIQSQELFQQEATQYFLDCIREKRESDCWGLLGIANEYYLKDKENLP